MPYHVVKLSKFAPTPSRMTPWISAARVLLITSGLGIMLFFGAFANAYYVGLANLVWIAIIGAVSQGLLLGWAGQVSLGFAAFFATGGMAVTLLSRHVGVRELLLALPAAFTIGMTAGVLVGAPAARMRGLYLAVSSLAFHFVLMYLIGQYQHSVGGSEVISVSSPSLVGLWTIRGTHAWYFALLTFAVLVITAVSNLGRSRFGRAWKTIHHREVVAASFGMRPIYLKLLAFAISSGIAAVAGALDAYHNGFVSQERYPVFLTIQYLAMIVLGGIGAVPGWVVGAACITLLPFGIDHIVRSLPGLGMVQTYIFQIQQAIFGIILLAVLLVEPAGLLGMWNRLMRLFTQTFWSQLIEDAKEHAARAT